MTTDPRVQVLSDEFTLKRASLDALDKLAADEKRDLTPEEQAEYDGTVTRMEVIETTLGKLAKDAARFDAVAETVTRAIPAAARTNPRPVELPSLGEQILIRARAEHDRVNGRPVSDEFETLQRALLHGVSTDGTSPTTIEGDLVKFVDASRNAVNASRQIPMPDNHSKTFTRPRWTVSTSVAAQAAEGDVLSSTRPVNVKDTVTKGTYGGTISLSEQEIDWTDPAMLGLATEDLAEQYGIVTDNVLCDAIEAASTAAVQTVVSNTATAAQFTAAVAAATGIAYGTSKRLPNVLYVAVDRWAYIVGLTDTTGRPVFPVTPAQNTIGTNPAGVTAFNGSLNVLGLNVVVDPNFTAGFWSVANSFLVESYEQRKGLLQVAAPSTLETTIAYRGYFAANVYSQAFGPLETA